jgi:hypothetical protein
MVDCSGRGFVDKSWTTGITSHIGVRASAGVTSQFVTAAKRCRQHVFVEPSRSKFYKRKSRLRCTLPLGAQLPMGLWFQGLRALFD